MRIAVATDRDFVADHFGCAPACTIFEVEDGVVRELLVLPNPGFPHAFWGELFVRNSVTAVVAGTMGQLNQSILKGWNIQVILGVSGSIDDLLERVVLEGIQTMAAAAEGTAMIPAACCC